MSMIVIGGATLPVMATERRGKSLTDAENDKLREVVRKKLLPKYEDNQSVAGPKVGVTQAAISRILKGGGGSLELAKAVAKDLGLDLEDVLGWPPRHARKGDDPRFSDNPIWRAASRDARRMYGDLLPTFAFDRADATKGGAMPSNITPKTVFDLAKWWFDTASMKDRIEAERAEIQAKKAEEDAVRPAPASGPVDTTPPRSGTREN